MVMADYIQKIQIAVKMSVWCPAHEPSFGTNSVQNRLVILEKFPHEA